MSMQQPVEEFGWTARKAAPMTLVYVVSVFGVFMGFAYFVAGSPDGVGALLLAAVGAVSAMVPSLLTRTEYRMTESGVWRRTGRRKEPKEFEEIFSWRELDRLEETGSGFKYWKSLPESGPVLAFWRHHLTAEYSGELQLEKEDRPALSGILRGKGLLKP